MASVLGHRLKLLREAHGMDQIELSKKLNIANSTLSQYETGKRVPSDDIKIAIANYFNVSVDYLLGNDQADKKINVFDFAMAAHGENYEVYRYFIELYQNGMIFIGQAQATFMKNAAIHDKIFFNCKESFTIYDLFEAYAYIYEKEVPKHPVWSTSWYRIEYIKLPPTIISVRKNEGSQSLIVMNARAFPLPQSQKDAELLAFGGPALRMVHQDSPAQVAAFTGSNNKIKTNASNEELASIDANIDDE